MKKYVLLAISILFCSCGMFYHGDLNRMESAVRQQIKMNDKKNEIHTDISVLKALSFEEIPKLEREQPEDRYRCKLYFSAKWSYLVGGRVYNVNDTLIYLFDKDKVLLRRDKKEK